MRNEIVAVGAVGGEEGRVEIAEALDAVDCGEVHLVEGCCAGGDCDAVDWDLRTAGIVGARKLGYEVYEGDENFEEKR